MKNLTFIAAAFLAFSTAFAQSSSTAADAKAKALQEGNGQAVTETAQQLNATKAEAEKTDSQGQTIALVAQQATVSTAAEVSGQVKNVETHGAIVAEVAQQTQTEGTRQGQEKGQEVKEVATAKRSETPAKAEAAQNAGAGAKIKSVIRRGGASRAAGAARAAGAVNAAGAANGGRGTVQGAANGAAKPVKAAPKGASSRPVQVGGAVKINSRAKIGN